MNPAAPVAEDRANFDLADPRGCHALAREQMEAARFGDALETLEIGLRASPDDPALLLARANSLGALGHHELAIGAFEQVLKLAPGSYLAGIGLAGVLSSVGDFEGSERQYRLIAAAAPGAPDPPAGLALLAAKRGQVDEAVELANEALSLRDSHPPALQALIEAMLLKRDYPNAERLARSLLAAAADQEKNASLAWVRLGDALHGQRRFREAFAAYAEGKRRAGQRFSAEFDIGRETTRQQAERLLAEIGAVDFANPVGNLPAAPPDNNAPALAFVVGFPRSGTTLLEEILASHPDIVSLDERATLAMSENEFLIQPGGLQRLAEIDPQTAALHRQAFWQAVDAWAPKRGSRGVIDKMPLRSLSLPVIAKLFPEARVLLCVRDPRDVVLSCFRRTFSINRTTYEFTGLERTARFYDSVMRLIEAYREKLKLNLRVVRHEALVEDFSGEVARILDFVGLSWTIEVTNFASSAKKRAIRTPSANQIREGINRNMLGQWKDYQVELDPVLPLLDPWVRFWGYDV